MIAPLPNCFSIAAIAADTAFNFSFMLDMRSLLEKGPNAGVGRAREGLRAAARDRLQDGAKAEAGNQVANRVSAQQAA